MNRRKRTKPLPTRGKPKKEREPLTEAQRLKRQKMIVLPAMVLVFIGAMWLIFAPSSGKEQPPGTDGYNTEMPDADKANRQIIGDKLKAYEHGEMEERQESRNRAIGQLGDMFDREIAGTEDGTTSTSPIRAARRKRAQPATPQTIQSSAAAYRDLNATLGNFYEQPKKRQCRDGRIVGAHRIAGVGTGKREGQGFLYGRAGGSYGEVLRAGGKVHGRSERRTASAEQAAEPTPCRKGKKNTATRVSGRWTRSSSFFTLHSP